MKNLATTAHAVVALCCCAVLVGCCSAAMAVDASAYYGKGAKIVSADLVRQEQGDDGTQAAAISRDGRYVAFQTRSRNFFADNDPDPSGKYRVGGIFRRDLDGNGPLELVADGDLRDEQTNALLLRGAQSPSISANGRYITFSSTQQLVVEDDNHASDVYVRDMTVPIRAAGAFELVSAKDGSSAVAQYSPHQPPIVGGDPGSDTWPGKAISSDGRKVVFRTLEQSSDLPDRPSVDTPPSQLFVRDLDQQTTKLLTLNRQSNGPAGGAVGPAAISGDGSTVVWTGQNAGPQTRFLGGEINDSFASYYLWRRIDDGASAGTRRITGVADVDDPGCPVNGSIAFDPTATGPCYGPLTDSEQGFSDVSSQLPAISDNGYRIAFVASGGPRPTAVNNPGLDLFTTDMSPGVSRKQGTIEWTREGVPGDLVASAPINGVAMSGDGQHIALVTDRISFVLPSPTFNGAKSQQEDYAELYEIDAAAKTIERVTQAYDGSEVSGDTALAPTMSGDGARIAFVSTASNQFYGDANERPDAFVATRSTAPADAAAEDEDPLPPSLTPLPPDSATARITVKLQKSEGGKLRVTVRVPAAGTVKAIATSRRKRKQAVVAKAKARTRAAGQTALVLRPSKKFRKQIDSKGKLTAQLTVTFAPAGTGARLRDNRSVVFAK